MKKKIISVILALFMCISLSVTAFAYDLFYDTYKKAAEALHEKYPDISVDDFMDEFSNFLNEPLDQEKINEAIQNLINRMTPTTDPNAETTTKKETTTKRETTTKERTTKREESTTAAPSFTIPSGIRNNNNNHNNNTTAPNIGGITIPQVTENSSFTQTVPVVSMYQQNSPNINNNKTSDTPGTVSDKSTVSSKTIMAWVIIAVGVMLLIVSIVVIVMSSDRRSSSSRRNRKRMRKNGGARKDYVPFTETTMPEVTVNTAADLAEKKHLYAKADKAGDYKSFFDSSTASALDSAVIVAAEGSSYTGSSAPDVDTTVAENMLKKSAKTVRVCEDCGTTVPEDMMFGPKCGTFMGIVSDVPAQNETAGEPSDSVTEPDENNSEKETVTTAE